MLSTNTSERSALQDAPDIVAPILRDAVLVSGRRGFEALGLGKGLLRSTAPAF